MKIRFFSILVFIVLFTLSPAQALAAEWYVATTGTAGGSGSIGSPWDLQTALSHSASIQPGDTIWLRGGTYNGIFTSTLTGNSGNPIIVRQYPDERATLDGGSTDALGVLIVSGSYVHYWGFEVMLSDTSRFSLQPGDPTDIIGNAGIYTTSGTGNKFINLIVHDTRNEGFGSWAAVADGEMYGNIVYNNGWDGPDRGHGHGFYMQNNSNTIRLIKDNIAFNQFSSGIKAWADEGTVNDFTITGNVMFNNGILSDTTGFSYNLLVGTESPGNIAENPIITNNYTYYTTTGSGGDNVIGDIGGCDSPTITNNYFAHGNTNALRLNCTNVTMTDNTFYSVSSFISTYSLTYPNNIYFLARPQGTKIFVRPNTYDTDRAHIIVYNWDNKSSVEVDVSSVLSNNQTYKVYDVENYFGAPITTGTYTGESISIPMNTTSVTTPIGSTAPAHTPTEFGVFVLVGGAVSSTSTPSTPTLVSASTASVDTTSNTTTVGVTVSATISDVKLAQTSTGNTFTSGSKNLLGGFLEFSGKASEGSFIRISLVSKSGKKIPGSTNTDENGIWSWVPSSNLKPGDYTATFLVQDKHGNTGSTTLKFTIDENGDSSVIESVQESSGNIVVTEEQQTLIDDILDYIKDILIIPLQGIFN